MRFNASILVSAILLVVLLSIRVGLYLTDYSIANSGANYLLTILILGLISYLFFRTTLPNQLKVFVLIAIVVVVTARIGLNYFMSILGERTLEKIAQWEVAEYTIVKQLNIGWTGPPYEACFVIESKFSGLIIKTSPVQQIDSCTFIQNKNDRNILIDVCNKKMSEEPDQTDR